VKRLFDLVISALGLVLLAPFFLVVAAAIKLQSRGPVFYRGERIGKDGKPFRIFKFRTMVADAAAAGPGITPRDDPRITPLGRFLRRFKIDELPQLINVLKGEMSLVGPRPEDPRYVAHYTSRQREVLSVRPGITSPASLYYRREESLLVGNSWERTYLDVILPHKLEIELDYLQRATFLTDLELVFKTAFAVLR